MLASLQAWVAANGVLFAAIWTIVTALASLGYTALDKTTTGHKVLSLVAGFGIDIPQILSYLRALLTGQPPSGPGASGGGHNSVAYSPRPETPFVVTGVAGAFVLAALCLPGCAAFQSSKLPSDLEAAGECVAADLIKGVTSPVQVMKDCSLAEEQTAVDAIAFLLDSAQFAKANPGVVATMKPVVAAHRAGK